MVHKIGIAHSRQGVLSELGLLICSSFIDVIPEVLSLLLKINVVHFIEQKQLAVTSLDISFCHRIHRMQMMKGSYAWIT